MPRNKGKQATQFTSKTPNKSTKREGLRGYLQSLIRTDLEYYVVTTQRATTLKRRLSTEEVVALEADGCTVVPRILYDQKEQARKSPVVDDLKQRTDAGMKGSKASQQRGRWEGKKVYRAPEGSVPFVAPERDAKGRKGSLFTHKVLELVPGDRNSRVRVPRND